MIYRVTVSTTGCKQTIGTLWHHECIYCATNLEDARIAYLKSRVKDFGGSHGSPTRKTTIEAFESYPDDPDSES